MANDITTLAIEIQSQEAGRNLRTFNELLSLSSQTAQKMEKVSIEIDVQGALSQLQALKTGYDDLAASAQNVHIDLGGSGAQTVDTNALDALKEFFATTAEMSKAMREEMEKFSETIQKLETESVKVSTAGGRSASSMRGGAAVSKEYAAALRELVAAQKEMEKAAAQADEAMKATVAADEDATAVKKRLIQAQRELAQVSAAIKDFNRTHVGNIIELSEKEEYLKNKVAELKNVYAEAKAAAEKFNQKLEESGAKADLAAAKYKEIKARVESMPQNPMGGTSQSTQTFAEKAKLAGRDITKLTRGINGLASMAGAAIPGISGLGRAITMLGMNPYFAAVALAIAACVSVYREYDKVMQDTAVASREMAQAHAEATEKFKKEAQERKSDLDRLAVLNNYEHLYDVEKEESREIVERLTAAYGKLGIQYDALTGKVLNLSEVTKQMNEQDRQRLLEKSKGDAELAWRAAEAQLAESQRNSIGWWRNYNTGIYGLFSPGFDFDLFGQRIWSAKTSQDIADESYDWIRSAEDVETMIKRLDEQLKTLYEMRTEGSDSAWYLDAEKWTEQLKKSKAALLEYQKYALIYQEFQKQSGVGGGRSKKEIGESLRARQAKLDAAELSSLEDWQRYTRNVEKISELEAKKQKFSELDPQAEVAYGGKIITAKEALLDIETEITNRTRERLAYEKQLEALNAKIEEQKRLWNMDDDGNIVGKKNDAEIRAYRNSKIDELQAQIQEMKTELVTFDKDDEGAQHVTKEAIALAQLKLNSLQQEKIADMERAKREAELAETAKKQLAEARKAYVIDADGNIIRKKNAEELAEALKAEVEAAKQRVADARKRAAETAAREQAAQQAEAELAELRKQYNELHAKWAKLASDDSTSKDDPEFKKVDEDLEKLRAKIEEAKKRAEEARKKAVSTGSEADVAKAEAEVTRLQAMELAQKEALEAAQRRAEEAKRGLVFDQNGNIVREQTQEELAEALTAEIEAQRERIEKIKEGTQEWYEANAKLTELLRREWNTKKQEEEKAKREREAVTEAQKRAEDTKKGYIWDEEGNIVRRKNEEELEKEREKEIEAAKEKVAATKAGTKERAEAEAELRRLQTAAFNAKEQKGGDGSFGMMKEEQKVNSNLVKGVDVKSAESLALQARNFTRGADPEKKVETSLKEIEKLNVQIRDFLTKCADYLDNISADSDAIAQKVIDL